MSEQWNMKVFMKGAVMLTMAAIIVKLLSAVYRVPFQNLVGDQGFYIYQQVYPFIGIFTVWTSYGFSVAISKMLADREAGAAGSAGELMKIAFTFLSVISMVFFIILFGGADLIAGWMGDSELASLLRAGSFVVLLMPFLSLLKGSFQARGRMQPVAMSQVVEQAVRVTVILTGTYIVVKTGASLYAAGQMAMWGAVTGEIAGVVLLILYFRKVMKGQVLFSKQTSIQIWPTIKEMTFISLSVSMSSLILLFFQLVDSFSVFSLLVDNGMARVEAMETKGVYDRGQPLVQMGILIASTLSLAIVPLVAHTQAKKEGRSDVYVQLTFRIAFLFGWAAALGLVLVMPYVNEMLFQTRDESATLMIFSVQILWLSLILTLTAVLQGLGRVKVPAILLIGGLLLKWLGNLWLIPQYGVMGAAIAGNIGFAAITVGLVLYFKRVWPVRLASVKFYSGLLFASIVMAAAVVIWGSAGDHFLFDGFSSRIGATLTSLSAVGIGAAVFLVTIAKLRIISVREWYLLPLGRRMVQLQLLLQKNSKG